MPNVLNKYGAIIKLAWQTEFAFRASFIIWRMRNFLGSLIALTVWTVIYSQHQQLFGYSQDQMITYIFLVSILQSTIFTTQLNGLASDVYSGQISHRLVKPMSFFGFLAAQDVSDKAKNIFFVIIESVALFFIFKPDLVLPTGLVILITICLILLGVLLSFIINVLFGAIGFWSPDSWGPKFLFYMFAQYTAGQMFPLDILPTWLQRFFYLTPFPYLSYVQTQLFLGRTTIGESMPSVAVLLVWIVSLGLLTNHIWQRGLKDYAAAGQ